MKTFVLAAAALTAMAATPALARSDTHISFGIYSPAPVVYQPAPVSYYPAYPVYSTVRYVPYSYHYHGPRWADRWDGRGHHRGHYKHDRRDGRHDGRHDGRGRH